MSIDVRPSGTDPSRGSRTGEHATIDLWSGPSGSLLHPDGVADPLHGRRPAFTRRVETVRRHLEPIRSRRALASSFAREAFTDEAIRTAYAIRWLELEARAPRRAAAGSRLPAARRRGGAALGR